MKRCSIVFVIVLFAFVICQAAAFGNLLVNGDFESDGAIAPYNAPSSWQAMNYSDVNLGTDSSAPHGGAYDWSQCKYYPDCNYPVIYQSFSSQSDFVVDGWCKNPAGGNGYVRIRENKIGPAGTVRYWNGTAWVYNTEAIMQPTAWQGTDMWGIQANYSLLAGGSSSWQEFNFTVTALPDVTDYAIDLASPSWTGVLTNYTYWDDISVTPEDVVAKDFTFGTATDAMGYAHTVSTILGGLPDPTSNYTVNASANETCITVYDYPKSWLGCCDAGSVGQFQSQLPLYGGEVIQIKYNLAGYPADGVIFNLQYYGGQQITIATTPTIIADGQDHILNYTMPSNSVGMALSSLVVFITHQQSQPTTLCLERFTVLRNAAVNNMVSADTILATPPVHNATVGMFNGAMTMLVDGVPISGLGWACNIDQNVSSQEMNSVIGGAGLMFNRVNFALGEMCYLRPNLYPPTWLGPDLYDWSYLDNIVAKFTTANPQAKLIMNVCLDGALWWTQLHREAGGVEANIGIPDYLSSQWESDSRTAIRQMIAHIQTSTYSGNVIGYELMNGATLDCGFEVNDSTAPAVQRFRAWLQTKYGTVAALQTAWGDSTVTFANALPDEFFDAQHPYGTTDPSAILYQPSSRVRYTDAAQWRNQVYQQVVLNFAADVKEATQGRVIVGVRTGNFMGNSTWMWNWSYQEWNPIDQLLTSPNLDFLDVQEEYVGRCGVSYPGDGTTGSGVPVLPPQALAPYNKLVVVQNDWRTHTGPDFTCGGTANVQQTIQVQRQVLTNSIVLGMSEYLWQMSYSYNDPVLIADMAKYEDIARKSLFTDRHSGAQVAFVFDSNYRKYFGYNSDPYYYTPSKGFALFDELKQTWARAGVPFDMVFLDQLSTSMTYKIYVFVDTVAVSDAQMGLINSVVKRNNNVGIFLWADGYMDGSVANASRMSTLTGMTLSMVNGSRTWQMTPTAWAISNMGVTSNTPMGTLANYTDGGTAAFPFYPYFVVNDAAATSIATYTGHSDVGIAKKSLTGWTSIFANTGNVVPSLLKYAISLTGVFRYTNSQDICYINNSFIGLHPQTTGTITVSLPASSALYDVFNDVQLAPASSFNLSVTAGISYLYYRGTRRQWLLLDQLLVNSSFEDAGAVGAWVGTTGWTMAPGSFACLGTDSTNPHSGTYDWVIGNYSDGGAYTVPMMSQVFSTNTSDSNFTVSGWVRTNAVGTASIRIRENLTGAAGTVPCFRNGTWGTNTWPIASTASQTAWDAYAMDLADTFCDQVVAITNAANWTPFSVTVPVLPNVTSYSIDLSAGHGGGVAYFDDITVTPI